jgi:hypothetical protein
MTYQEGDAVWMLLGGSPRYRVGHIVRAAEVDTLNAGGIPKMWGDGGVLPVPDDEVIHYHSTCGGGPEHEHLAWSGADVTCPDCLRRRAVFLRGWRWNHEVNAEEVAHIQEMLGEEVAGFGDPRHGAEIHRHARPFSVDVKRFHIPVTLTSKCPGCGTEVEKDLTEKYLSYPNVGVVEEVSFYHECSEPPNYKCEEWSVPVVLDIHVRMATDEEVVAHELKELT